jgi:C-terminal processing protease CtpA/Prc
MQLNTFAHAKLRRFIKTGFRTLHKTSVKHLVIDLRNNGGGRINKSALLARYISDHPFRMADSVSANRLRFPYPGRVTHHLLYTWFGPFFTYKGADGRRHMGTLERNWHQPKKKHHFDGQVYVIAGGFTFSAATMFISALGQQPNITGVGEETGGGARGNSSVMTPMVVLPNTGVRAWLPLFRIVSRVDLPQNGRGVMPQVPVPPSAWHITRGRDPKMDKVMQLITERKAAGAVQHP